MNKDDFILAEEFEADLRAGYISYSDEIREKLKKINSRKILVSVYKNINDDLNSIDVDKELFLSIEKMQRLPANIVLDFLSVKGEIHDKDFLDRLKNAR